MHRKVTGWDTGLNQDYDRKLGQWFANRMDSRYVVSNLFKENIMKTSELTGPALDWAAAKAQWGEVTIAKFGPLFGESIKAPCVKGKALRFAPSVSWAHGGPIIEREWLHITPWPNETNEGERWQCVQYDASVPLSMFGPTPLIAAMRCYVASKLGETVDVPEELC